jgi:hypothetical protein
MTLAEVLKKSGWSDEQIAALDAKAMSGLTEYVSTVEKTATEKETAAKAAADKAEADRKTAEASLAAAKAAQDAAELQKRSVDEFWKDTYAPGIKSWEEERAKLAKAASDAAAEAAYYKTQRENYLKNLNIDPASAPVFTPSAVVPPAVDPNKTPGTPTFVDPNEVYKRVDKGVYTIQDIGWKYQQLYGTPIPVSPSELIAQADAIKLSPMEYAARTFKFAEKEQAAREAAAKAHDDQIAAAAVATKEEAHKAELKRLQDEFNTKEKLRAEQGGNNPFVKTPPGSAKFSDLQRAVKAGERPDPTRMTPQERRAATLNAIHKNIEEREQAVA